jgi:hypothetical protein
VDYNHQQSYDTTDRVLPLEPLAAKWTPSAFRPWKLTGTMWAP